MLLLKANLTEHLTVTSHSVKFLINISVVCLALIRLEEYICIGPCSCVDKKCPVLSACCCPCELASEFYHHLFHYNRHVKWSTSVLWQSQAFQYFPSNKLNDLHMYMLCIYSLLHQLLASNMAQLAHTISVTWLN